MKKTDKDSIYKHLDSDEYREKFEKWYYDSKLPELDIQFGEALASYEKMLKVVKKQEGQQLNRRQIEIATHAAQKCIDDKQDPYEMEEKIWQWIKLSK